MANPGLHLTVECAVCAEPYRQSRSDQRFCSGRCASEAWRKRRAPIMRACGRCGVPFAISGSASKYCGPACIEAVNRDRLAARNSGVGKGGRYRGKHKVPRHSCEVCKEPFYAPPSQILRGGGKFCSVACRARFQAQRPELFPQTKTRRGRGGKRADLNNAYFRSSWEANWARYLNWQVKRGEIIGWEYEPQTFEFVGIKRGSRFYTPDFRITTRGGVVWHEIKGYMDQRSATKIKRMRRYHPGVELLVIERTGYKAVEKAVGALIPNWEARR